MEGSQSKNLYHTLWELEQPRLLAPASTAKVDQLTRNGIKM